jgi:pimeloyl-ACP methyl ester carboxylesterase
MIETLKLDSDRLTILGQPISIAVDLFVPDRLAAGAKLLICLPGGGITRRYYDLQNGEDQSFSFAHALCAAGHVVALVDPPGVGDSDRIDDGYQLTVAAQMPLLAAAVAEIRALSRQGVELASLPVVGVGHSAGSMLTAALQAHSQPYEAVILLCFGTGGLPQYLKPDYLAALRDDPLGFRANISEHARHQFATGYFASGERPINGAAGRALEAVKSATIAPVALQAMTPGNVAPELASITVPIFTAVGERDITGPAHLLPQAYSACPDFTQIIVKNAGHHVFVVPAATELFRRICCWLDGIWPR